VAHPEFSDDEIREMHALLQTAALHAYPNPDRIGCPGRDVLNEIAASHVPSAHLGYEHVKTCSPCLGEMLELRGETIRVRRARARKARVFWFAAVAAALVIGVVLGLVFMPRKPSMNELQAQVVVHGNGNLKEEPWVGVLDYRNSAPQRGGSSVATNPPVLARSTRELFILLPTGSQDGAYTLEFRNPKSVDIAVARFQAETSTEHGRPAMLVGKVDLSRLPSGSYVVAWRRDRSDHWDYGSFGIE
jgi:hypothetical protein